jgi:multiple sugar transport system permease protein
VEISTPIRRSQTSTFWRGFRKSLPGFLFILPSLVLFILFRIWPTINGFLLSFQDYRINQPTTWIGLDHFRFMLEDDIFWGAMKVTVTYALIAVPLSTVSALALALLINRALRGISFFRAIYFLPYITSLVMVSVVWSWVYRTNGGLLNSILDAVGIAPVKWLTSQDMVLPSLAIMATWKGVGYAMMILLAGLRAIPVELGEASSVDGATSGQTFWRIILPLLKPVLFFVIVIETIGSFQVFDAIFVMTQGGPVRASYSLVYMLYDESFKFSNYGYGAAIGMVLFVITFGVTILQRLMFGKEEA